MISVIAWDGGFREHFFQIDSLVNQTIGMDQFEYHYVDCFHTINPDLVARLLQYPNLKTHLHTLKRDTVYHPSKCANYGGKLSHGDILVFLDADTYLEPDVLEAITLELQKPRQAIYVCRYDEPEPGKMFDGAITLKRLRKHCTVPRPNNYGGFLALYKDKFFESGGFEEHPVFSGKNSSMAWDLRVRLENMGMACTWDNSLRAYHPRHALPSGYRAWNGFRVESQRRIIKHNQNKGVWKPFIGLDGRYREEGEWWEKWLGKFDSYSVGYNPAK